jgi:uncharacterized protein (DUF1800 family)
MRRSATLSTALFVALAFAGGLAGAEDGAPAAPRDPPRTEVVDPLAPIAAEAWTPACAAHLLSRAGFGGTREEIDALYRKGPEAAVDLMLNGDGDGGPDFVPSVTEPPDRKALRDMTPEARKEAGKEFKTKSRAQLQQLREWWVGRMIRTRHPLEEKMTLFWHGHFTSAMSDVKNSYLLWLQNRTLRRYALGNFGALTQAIAKDPAMLVYLNNDKNRRSAPNENFARELMELFTLGIGNYDETDVKEAARAFTGWTFEHAAFVERKAQHDDGTKTVLGRKGNLDGEDVIATILAKPETARFIAAKIFRYFAHEAPADDVIEGLAKTLRASGYEVRPMLHQLFLSQAFYDERAIGTRVKSPIELFVGAFRILPFDRVPTKMIAPAAARLGQDLFQPPNVKGWPGGRDWISTSTFLERQRLVSILFGRVDPQALREASRREKGGKKTPPVVATTRKAADGAPDGEGSEPQATPPQGAGARNGRRGLALFDSRAYCTARGLDTAEKVVEHLSRLLYARPLEGGERQAAIDGLGRDGRGEPSPFRLDGPDAGARIDALLRRLVEDPRFQLG